MKDYIIFKSAPNIIFNCNEPIHDWYLNTSQTSEKTRILGTISTTNCEEDFSLFEAPAEIKIRGNYTANYAKKPFQIKFSEKQNLFGLNKGNKHKKWILLAEYNDSSMLRNAFAFYLSKQLFSNSVWVPTFTFAHFYIQDSEQQYYMGLYLLVDQKEQAKNRVNVFEPEDGYEGTDIGYFFERDDYYETETDPTFTIANREYTPAGLRRTSHESNRWARQTSAGFGSTDGYSIKSKITNAETQIPFLKDHLLKVYNIIYNAVNNNEFYELDSNGELVASNLTDPIKVLNKVIDLDSFVSMYLLHEVACNPDIGHSSFYLSLDMSETGNKLLTLCCPWDFDLALGLAKNFAQNPTTAGLWAKQCTLNPWIYILAQADWFIDLVKAKWQGLYNNDILRKTLLLLEDYSRTYEADFKQNFEEWDIKWQNHRTWNDHPDTENIDGSADVPGKVPNNFVRSEYCNTNSQIQCKNYLRSWIIERYAALHSLFDGVGEQNWDKNLLPNYDHIVKTRDYIIFENAPKFVFNYNENEYAFADWYTNVQRETRPRPEVPCSLTISNCPAKYQASGLELQYLRVRGNYTANYRKKSLKIKFNEKQKLFGLNNDKKAKEWVLMSDHGDNSMMRDALAYYMGQKLLNTAWSPTFTFVHVYANEEYLGLYLLADQREVDKNRININEPEKNYTGVDIGYFFERDDYYDPEGEDPGFVMQNPDDYLPAHLPYKRHPSNNYYGIGSIVRDGYTIHSKIYSEDQENFLKKYVCLIYTILYEACLNETYYELNSTDISNWENWELVESELTDPQEVVSKVIDLDSFINMYILQEFVGDPDLAHSSFFLSLDASATGNKKLTLTCPWDHDRCFGLCDGLKDANTQSLWVKDANNNPWVSILAKTDWFVDLLKARWQELYNNNFFARCLNMLDDYSATYKADFAQNYAKYNIRWEDEGYTVNNPLVAASINFEFYSTVETQEDTKELLRNWINTRFKALHTGVFEFESSTDWPEPEDPPEPEPEPQPEPITGDETIFRKDKLVKAYTETSWNQMYNNAASQKDELVKLWNQLYKNPSNTNVILYNKMYAAVCAGKKLTDPELQADLKAWNANAAR